MNLFTISQFIIDNIVREWLIAGVAAEALTFPDMAFIFDPRFGAESSSFYR